MTFSRGPARWAGAHSQALGLSFLLALGAAIVFWFFAFFVPGQRQAAIGEWRRDLSVIADTRRDLLDRRISERVEDARFVATFPTVRALVSSARHGGSGEEPGAHVEGILSNFRNVYGERSISICDAAGAVLVSSDGPAPGAEPIALAREAMRSGKPRVDLVREPDGFIGFVIAVPVAGGSELAEAGAAGAVLVVGDADGLLFDLLSQPVRTRQSGEVLLMRRDQESILYLSPLLFRKDPPLTFRRPFETLGLASQVAIAGEDSFSAYVDYRNVRTLAATRRLTRAPWGLVVKVDEDEALAAFREDVLRRGLMWGGLLLALIAAAFGLWRALVASHEVTLARGEARFGALVEQATDAIFLFGNDGRILRANRAAEVMYGWTRDELLSMHAADVRASGTRDALRHDMEIAAARGSLLVETRHRHADGSEFPVEVNLGLVKAGDETVFLSIVRDIRARRLAEDRIRNLNSLLRTITDVSQLIVKAPEEKPLLAEVCQILVRRAGYVTAWIGRADQETKHIVLVAHAGEGRALLESLDVRCDDSPLGRGPVGTAIREGRSVVVSDAPADPSLEPWKEQVKSIGVGAIAAVPLRRGGIVTAGLSVFAPEGASIDGGNLTLLEELAGDISYALDVLDARARANKSEQELRNLRQAVEQTHATVVITDLEGRIEYVNPSFTHVTGYTAEEVRGQNPRILKSDRTPPELYKELWETILGGRTWSGEICNKRKDGTLFWEQASISPVRDEAGVTRHYVAVKEDITDRKRAAEDLAKSELYFRSLIENSLDVTAVLGLDAHFRYVSPAMERLFGYRPEELQGSRSFDFLHPEDRPLVEGSFRRALEDRTRVEQMEFRFRHRDGSWRTISAMGKALPPETGVQGVIVNARDTSDRVLIEAKLRQAQKMEAVGRLAGGVAHDFNNLLTVIQGYAELLGASLANDPERSESLVEIVRAAERAAALTRQLLAFSRRQVLETRVLDLGAVVADTEKMLRRLIGEDVEVVVVKPATLSRVKADPGQIEQVLLNLAVNSRDAMPEGGRLTVELADVTLDAPFTTSHDSIPSGRYVVVSVRDTGCGMDAETLGHLFEPFFTTKEKGKGTGLGLATVFGIVKQSGGYVDVASAPGAGTTFRVYLPRSDEKRTSGVRPSVLSRQGTETVLVVEDEAAVRNLVRAVLERKGYVVLAAQDGAAALDLVDKHTGVIHVLLTDVVMPGMNGRDLAARVRARRPTIKVVFMSGYTADIPADFGTEGGPAFLSKPFNERALTVKLREVLDTPPA